MLYEIIRFEILYRIKRLDTYCYFIFLFLFSVVGVDFIYSGVDLGPVKRNAPLIIAKTMGICTGLSMMVTSLIMGVPILRDFEHQIESLMFVNPIKKSQYMLGRFLGSFIILLLIYTAVIWGNALGSFMPWRDASLQLPFDMTTYVQPYFTVVLPILFFGATLFFVTGALSKKLIVVYTQGLFTFVLFMLTRTIENRFLGAILDPFSLTTLTEMTKHLSPSEINENLIPFAGVLLYNKLFWMLIGLLIFAVGYHKFKFQVMNTSRRKKRKDQIVLSQSKHGIAIPTAKVKEGLKAQWQQLLQHSWFYFSSILKEVSFWAIVICAMVIIMINSIGLDTVYGVNSYPTTYLIVEELIEMSGYFFIIVMVFYSGELIWKERGAKLHLIYDALPSYNGINLLGKFIGLTLTYMVLMLALIVAGVVFQTVHGYYAFELDVYFMSFFGDLLPFLLMYTFISFFIHVVVNKKFVAYLLVLTCFIASIALDQLGYNHDLYSFGGHNIGIYSDMNGYGHFLTPFLWVKAYWFVIGGLILLVASLFVVRGTEISFKIRMQQAKQRMSPQVRKIGLTGLGLVLALGSFIYYNTNVLNTRWSDAQETTFRAGYEQDLKKYEEMAQPTLVGVHLTVDLYPAKRNYTATGTYTLVNKSGTPLHEVHVQKRLDNQISLENITVNRTASLQKEFLKYDYYVYVFSEPLAVGDSLQIAFTQQFTSQGFESGPSNTQIVGNGTFFNNKVLPSIGYNQSYELRNEEERKRAGLAPKKGMAARDHAFALKNGVPGDDGYQIDFEMIIGTAADQTAIAPGSLLKRWEKDNRAYFHYKMQQSMVNFYAVVSAKYEKATASWIPQANSMNSNPVALEIYYHKGHEYNLDRMFSAMKKSFDYFSSSFSAYQYPEMRIMEFPRYASYAQSFPNTVPFSESLGFVLDIDDTKDVDMAFYITAHELAHQWWGLQVVAANVQGRLFILESLAQYSALMALQQTYGKEKVRQFLEGELEKYHSSRNSTTTTEVPLALVGKEDHIYYSKGAINLYRLQEILGEESLNKALQQFVTEWNAFAPQFDKNRYATSTDVLKYIYQITPAAQKTSVSELLESVISYDLALQKASFTKKSTGEFVINAEISAKKWDIEQRVALATQPISVVIAVYGLDAHGKEQLLQTQEVLVDAENKALQIHCTTQPYKILIDPDYRLLDINRANNSKKL